MSIGFFTAQLRPAEAEHEVRVFEQYAFKPATAGDLIDSTVRLYREHFQVWLRLVLAPGLLAYAGGVLFAAGFRNFSPGLDDPRTLSALLLCGIGGLLWLCGKALLLLLLGGVARSLIECLFEGTRPDARAVYQTTQTDKWRLLRAVALAAALLLGVLLLAYILVAFALALYLIFAAAWLNPWPSLQLVAHAFVGILLGGVSIALLLLIYACLGCLPQIVLVEKKPVLGALARSFQLGRQTVKRAAALALFQIGVGVSLYWLLMTPLGWYGYWQGLELNPLSNRAPLWFTIGQQAMAQTAEILLLPLLLIGWVLLYLDVRVRTEGFDIELLVKYVLPSARLKHKAQPAAQVGDSAEAEASVTPAPAADLPDFDEDWPPSAPAPVIETVRLGQANDLRKKAAQAESAEYAEIIPLPSNEPEPAVQTIYLTPAASNETETAKQG